MRYWPAVGRRSGSSVVSSTSWVTHMKDWLELATKGMKRTERKEKTRLPSSNAARHLRRVSSHGRGQRSNTPGLVLRLARSTRRRSAGLCCELVVRARSLGRRTLPRYLSDVPPPYGEMKFITAWRPNRKGRLPFRIRAIGVTNVDTSAIRHHMQYEKTWGTFAGSEVPRGLARVAWRRITPPAMRWVAT